MKKLNLAGIYTIKEDLSKTIINNFITNVVVVNSYDILVSFSFYSEKKLLISLNHQNPFLGLVDKSFSPHTELGGLNDNLRKYLKGSYIHEIEVLNNDRVMKFTLHKSDEFYNKETYYLILELIPTISNLIFLNSKEEIIFAKHYSDLSASRPVIRKMKYVPLSKNAELAVGEFDYEAYKLDLQKYVLDSSSIKQKEKALPLYNFFKQKVKSLKKKIKVLEEEKDKANTNLIYKEYGQFLLTYKDDPSSLNPYILNIKDIYNSDLTVEENAEVLFNKYKKCKRTIENDIREIEIAKGDINLFEHYLSVFDYLSDEEMAALENKYLPNKKNNAKRKQVIDSSEPYYVTYKNTKIGFGKNKDQNNRLSFKLADKSHTFIHMNKMHGSHVIIFKDDIDNDVLLVGLEIALVLSGQEDGEIQVAKVKDIKKGHEVGQVLLDKYQTYNLKEVRDSTKELLKSQRRF